MKKLLVFMLFSFAIAFGAQAQTEVKVKKTTTPVQKYTMRYIAKKITKITK